MIIRKVLTTGVMIGLIGFVAGCSTPRGGTADRTGGQIKDDNKLSSQVMRELRNDSVFKYPGVQVHTYNGVAQLSGFVDTEAQKSRAEELASRVTGLTEVQNHIMLKKHQEIPNAENRGSSAARVVAPLATSGSATNQVDSTR